MKYKSMIIRQSVDLFFDGYSNVYRAMRVKNSCIFYRAFRKMRLPLNLFFAKWTHELEKYDDVIIFDNAYARSITKFIKKRYPEKKVILWYWNSLAEYGGRNMADGDRYVDEVWTYSKYDTKKYGFCYNTQFYSKLVEVEKNGFYDILFVGRDKGRNGKIDRLKTELASRGLKVKFITIKREQDLIPYSQYLKEIGNSKCILDLGAYGHSGLSLRPMETLFLKRKLITDNDDIVNYDFYRPENIFIIGKDDIGKLKGFIESPYKEIDKKMVDYYEFDNWLKRFGKEKK